MTSVLKPNQQQEFGLIVVSAPSGAGKSTLCTRLLSELKNRLSLSISTTSRAPRGQEQHGKEYFFVNRDAFLSLIDAGAFAEWALVHGNYYGTAKQTLQDFWAASRHVLLEIDVQGAETLRRLYPHRCLTLFVAPPSMEELERRLRGRGTETEEAIQKRLQGARAEMARQSEFDQVIVNDELEVAFAQLKGLVIDFMDRMEGGRWPKQS